MLLLSIATESFIVVVCPPFTGYHTPLDVYPLLGGIADNKEIHTLPPDRPVNVCVGKEWYRFPNSFFLPDK